MGNFLSVQLKAHRSVRFRVSMDFPRKLSKTYRRSPTTSRCRNKSTSKSSKNKKAREWSNKFWRWL